MNHVASHLSQTIALLENHDLPIDVGLLMRLELVVSQRRSFEQDRLIGRNGKHVE